MFVFSKLRFTTQSSSQILARTKFPISCAAAFFVQNANADFLPPNNLHLQDNLYNLANMTEQQFNTIINTIVEYYKPIAASKGATLSSNNLWTDTTVNASAIQTGTSWIVNMYGGLARRTEITPDGFALVVCHELGHHFGGFPFNGDTHWAAAEGQADYFATQSCAREIWRQQAAENSRYRSIVGNIEKSKCDAVWSQTTDQDLCYRIAAAGLSLANLFSELRSDKTSPRFETADATTVSSTFTKHPAAQCRLDTYLNGALCTAAFDKNVIPGRNVNGGQTSKETELTAAPFSCMSSTGYVDGVRPLCWFKPQLDFLAIQFSDVLYSEKSGNNNGVPEPSETMAANLRLSNPSAAPTTKIEGILTSRADKVEIISGHVQYNDIAPGSTSEARQPFVFRISDAVQCGEKVPLTIRVKSNQGSMEVVQEIRAGRLIPTNLGGATPNIPIPDEDRDGVDSTFVSTIEGSASGVAMQLDIDHPSIREITVSVISPDGKTYRIFPIASPLREKFSPQRPREIFSGIHKTIPIDARFAKLSGTWTLRVKDFYENNVGSIKSWAVVASKNQCD